MLSSFLNYFTCNFDAWLKTLCLLCIILVLIFNNHFFFATMYTLSTVSMPGLLHIFNEIHFITLKKILFFSLYLFTMLFFLLTFVNYVFIFCMLLSLPFSFYASWGPSNHYTGFFLAADHCYSWVGKYTRSSKFTDSPYMLIFEPSGGKLLMKDVGVQSLAVPCC